MQRYTSYQHRCRLLSHCDGRLKHTVLLRAYRGTSDHFQQQPNADEMLRERLNHITTYNRPTASRFDDPIRSDLLHLR